MADWPNEVVGLATHRGTTIGNVAPYSAHVAGPGGGWRLSGHEPIPRVQELEPHLRTERSI
jgi:hypothetical protein